MRATDETTALCKDITHMLLESAASEAVESPPPLSTPKPADVPLTYTVSRNMLHRWGWKEGTSLGLSGEGRVDPLTATLWKGRAGLGYDANVSASSGPILFVKAGLLQEGAHTSTDATDEKVMEARISQSASMRNGVQVENAESKGIAARREVLSTAHAIPMEMRYPHTESVSKSSGHGT